MAQKYEITVEISDNGTYILRYLENLDVCNGLIDLLEAIGMIVTEDEEEITLKLRKPKN